MHYIFKLYYCIYLYFSFSPEKYELSNFRIVKQHIIPTRHFIYNLYHYTTLHYTTNDLEPTLYTTLVTPLFPSLLFYQLYIKTRAELNAHTFRDRGSIIYYVHNFIKHRRLNIMYPVIDILGFCMVL